MGCLLSKLLSEEQVHPSGQYVPLCWRVSRGPAVSPGASLAICHHGRQSEISHLKVKSRPIVTAVIAKALESHLWDCFLKWLIGKYFLLR